jgi:hypothetical protein
MKDKAVKRSLLSDGRARCGGIVQEDEEAAAASSVGLSISEMKVASLKSTPFSVMDSSPILRLRVGVESVG